MMLSVFLEDHYVKGELLKNVPVLGKFSDAVEVIKNITSRVSLLRLRAWSRRSWQH